MGSTAGSSERVISNWNAPRSKMWLLTRANGGAGWTRTGDRRIMSLILYRSAIRGNLPTMLLTSSFDYPALPDASQSFAVHRGTHAGHITPLTSAL